MKKVDPPEHHKLISMTSCIAWLSLMLLSVAWGRTLDERWQGIWEQAGAFGLAAAVGLGSLEKARAMREKYRRDVESRVNSKQCEGRLTKLNDQSAALELIDEAIRRLTRHVATQRGARGKSPLSQFPLEVVPVEKNGGEFDMGSARSIAGSLRSISSRVVSFEHEQAFAERVVLLTFSLKKGERLCFVVDVMCSQIVAERFVSSGAVMAVGVPVDPEPEMALVEAG